MNAIEKTSPSPLFNMCTREATLDSMKKHPQFIPPQVRAIAYTIAPTYNLWNASNLLNDQQATTVLIGLIVSVEKLHSPIRIMLDREFWDGALGNAFQAAHPLQYRLIACLDPKSVTIEYLPA